MPGLTPHQPKRKRGRTCVRPLKLCHESGDLSPQMKPGTSPLNEKNMPCFPTACHVTKMWDTPAAPKDLSGMSHDFFIFSITAATV